MRKKRAARTRKTFLNDADGFSAKDYLLMISTVVFFLFFGNGLVMVLLGRTVDGMYLSLLDMVVPVVMTVVGGVMGVQAVESFSNRHNKIESEEINDEEY